MPNRLLIITIRTLSSISAWMIFSIAAWAACTGSSPNWISSPDRDSIASCVSQASSEDTIHVSAGDGGMWTSGIPITKPLKIMGPDSSASNACDNTGATLTAADNLTNGFFQISMITASRVRISGFHFVLGSFPTSNKYGIDVSGSITQMRIDHNRFDSGKYAINSHGNIKGVYDSNCFINTNSSIQLLGGTAAQADQSWADPIVAGRNMGLNTLYVENNQFIRDSGLDCHQVVNGSPIGAWLNCHIESGQGGKFVIRNNYFDGHLYCNSGDYTDYPIMTHGNGAYYSDGKNGLRGHPIVEIYNNTIRGYRVDQSIALRGGSNLVHHNATTYESGRPAIISLNEEECWSDKIFSPLRSTWPADDQIFNSFLWNNTVCKGYPCKGSDSAPVLGNQDPCIAVFIQEGRDYFVQAPQPSGGKTTFIGRPGGDMTFSASGPNAYYPYEPYCYPHPLRSGTLTAPQNVRLSLQ